MMNWHSPYETPQSMGNARRVLVWLEVRHNPLELNVPGKLSFGHRILPPRKDYSPYWPEDGWFFDGDQDYYRVAAWAYADAPTPEDLKKI